MAQQRNIEQPVSLISTGGNGEAETFAAVLSALDREQLATVTRTLRFSRAVCTADKMEPSVGDPIYGSYHVIFPLNFDDGHRWAAKIPSTARQTAGMRLLPLP